MTHNGLPNWTPASAGEGHDGVAGRVAAEHHPHANLASASRDLAPVTRDAADVADAAATFGERLSDRVAAVGGSWGFIIAFTAVLIGWMLLNSDVLAHLGHAFDPYPYIFLNLMLSTLAAVQAPIIMMSQNRQAAKDRLAARLDYEVNLRTEQAMEHLHATIDTAIGMRLDALLAAVSETGRAGRVAAGDGP